MNLLKEWEKLLENQTEETVQKFWQEYAGAEQKIYSYILEHQEEQLKGTFEELVEKFQCDKRIFMGFMDGINESLKNKYDLDEVTESTELAFDIDFEKLYYNMHKAEADHLYSIPSWGDVLDEEKRKEIRKDYNRSKIVVKEKKPGRNDPCPCGSGKKYKKCCGRN